jgi:hypothetical protein
MRSNQEFYLKRIPRATTGREHVFMGQFTLAVIKNSGVVKRNREDSIFFISEDMVNWYVF